MAVEQGKGVLFVYGCYAGDNLNFDMGEEFLNDDGIQTAHVRVWDDVASAPQERIEDRRGIAGDVFVVKIAGAACDAGLELEEVVRVTEKARDNTRTIGVATAPAQLPGVEQPIFTLGEGEIEYGMGLHGERGVLRTTWEDADVLAEKMYKQILDDSDLKTGDEVCVLVNGLGSTTITELAIAFRKVKKLLDADGIKVYDTDLNNYCTSQEMGGFSITLFKLDEELNAADARNMLLYIADKIIAKKPYLTEVDSAIGDGDHGIGMAGGMQKVKKKLSHMENEENVYALFEAAGKAMLLSMGGASGVIFGSLYLAGAKGMEAKKAIGAEELAHMEKKSLAAIQERGKAKVGDKTMVDALAPAVEAMEANSEKSLAEMLRAAEAAAKAGVENTKKYQAAFGRAKSLIERAIGYQDAGATFVWLIIQGMREFVEDICE